MPAWHSLFQPLTPSNYVSIGMPGIHPCYSSFALRCKFWKLIEMVCRWFSNAPTSPTTLRTIALWEVNPRSPRCAIGPLSSVTLVTPFHSCLVFALHSFGVYAAIISLSHLRLPATCTTLCELRPVRIRLLICFGFRSWRSTQTRNSWVTSSQAAVAHGKDIQTEMAHGKVLSVGPSKLGLDGS